MRNARRVPSQINKKGCCPALSLQAVEPGRTRFLRSSTHGVDLLPYLGEQAPLLRGCPDRGGERPAKGGARTLRSNVWGEARAAHFASPARQIKKAAQRAAFFIYLAERGGAD